jgi:PhnB protein
MPVQLMFWGDLYGQIRDPFGVTWALVAPAKKT